MRSVSTSQSKMSISKKLLMLAIGIVVLLGGMVSLMAFQSKSVLNEQVDILGLESVSSGAREVDQYFDKLKTLSISIADSAAELLETGKAVVDDDLESLVGRYYNSLSKDLNILDLYVGLETTGKLGTGSDWVEPDTYDARKRPWYIKAVEENKPILTEPYVDANTGGLIITVAAPVRSSSGKLLGAAGIDVSLQDLSKMITSYTILGKGYGFLIDQKGNFIAHPKPELVAKENITKVSSAINQAVAEAGKKILSGSKGFVDYEYQGEVRRTFYAPTKSGFILGIVFPESDLKSIVMGLVTKQAIFGIAAIIILGIVLYSFSKSIIEPVNRITASLTKLGTLDLTKDENEDWLKEAAKYNTEIGLMASSAVKLQKALRQALSAIADQSNQTAEVAETLASLSEESVATLEEMKASIDQVASLMESNSASLQEANASIEEVSSGAQQAAQNATEGAEAAAKMETLSKEVATRVKEVTNAISGAGEKVNETGNTIKEMADAVMSITKLVDAIKSIAGQTNLLALNAAIEAARAGEHGRGFAVVAEEVRKLAEESSKAAEEVEKIIMPLQEKARISIEATEDSEEAMQETIKMANESIVKLSDMLEHIKTVSDAMQTIAATVEEQAAAASEMAQGIENVTKATIDTVKSVNMIHQSGEETVKASESVAQEAQSLSHIAEVLKSLVQKFKI